MTKTNFDVIPYKLKVSKVNKHVAKNNEVWVITFYTSTVTIEFIILRPTEEFLTTKPTFYPQRVIDKPTWITSKESVKCKLSLLDCSVLVNQERKPTLVYVVVLSSITLDLLLPKFVRQESSCDSTLGAFNGAQPMEVFGSE